MVLHIAQRPHPTPILQDESCTFEHIKQNIGNTRKKRPKAGKRRGQSSIMPWRPPQTHVRFGRHRILQMSFRDEPGDCWK